ncbi:MAG: hypothetical protein ACLRZ9_10430 [Eubacterium sp.]
MKKLTKIHNRMSTVEAFKTCRCGCICYCSKKSTSASLSARGGATGAVITYA